MDERPTRRLVPSTARPPRPLTLAQWLAEIEHWATIVPLPIFFALGLSVGMLFAAVITAGVRHAHHDSAQAGHQRAAIVDRPRRLFVFSPPLVEERARVIPAVRPAPVRRAPPPELRADDKLDELTLP